MRLAVASRCFCSARSFDESTSQPPSRNTRQHSRSVCRQSLTKCNRWIMMITSKVALANGKAIASAIASLSRHAPSGIAAIFLRNTSIMGSDKSAPV